VIDWSLLRCRFGGHAPAVALVATSSGCTCFPDDRIQALCAQHVISAEPLGSFELIAACDPTIAARFGDRSQIGPTGGPGVSVQRPLDPPGDHLRKP